jgi:hypothetical protein
MGETHHSLISWLLLSDIEACINFTGKGEHQLHLSNL